MALTKANEPQKEEDCLPPMSKVNTEGPDINYVAPMTVSGFQNNEAHPLCKGDNDKKDPDLDHNARRNMQFLTQTPSRIKW